MSNKQSAAAAANTTMRDAFIIIGALVLITAGYFVLRERQEPPVPQGHVHTESESGMQGQMQAQTQSILNNLPAEYEPLVQTGNRFMDQGNYAIAAEAYRRALAIDPSSTAVRTDYGACLSGMGLPERAVEEFRTVLESEPDHPIATFNMGIVFLNMEKADSARTYLEKTIALEPEPQLKAQAERLIQQLDG
jgi:Tfp pilus assembly protein PilF